MVPFPPEDAPMPSDLPGSTELLLRAAERWRGRRVLVVDPPEAAALAPFRAAGGDGVRFLIRDYAVQRRAGDGDGRFVPWLDAADAPFDAVLLHLPKGKELLEMSLAMAAALLAEGGELLLAGGNKEGGKSAPKRLKERFAQVTKVESARHASLYAASGPLGDGGTLEDWVQSWTLNHSDGPLEVASLPGVFSHGRLDEGTQRLLEHLTLPDRGRILDLGCGAGIIGALIARARPACEVELVDASALACEASRRTLALNAIENARVHPSDVFSEVDGPFAAVVTNPPFHQGVATDYRLHRELAHQAARLLEPDGALTLVVNRFLRLGEMLEGSFKQVEALYEDNRFAVYRATGPKAR